MAGRLPQNMRTIELKFPETDPQADLESFCRDRGLVLSAPVSLASYAGCRHWHISHSELSGVLELTWWPGGKRFWIKIAANRDGAWIDGVVAELQGTNAFASLSPLQTRVEGPDSTEF